MQQLVLSRLQINARRESGTIEHFGQRMKPHLKITYPVTPDGRYFVVRGRLWRCSDPTLPADRRAALARELMDARRDKGRTMRAGDEEGREGGRQRVDAAKQALGELGPVWWTDGAPDWNRHMAKSTPYADWFAGLPGPPHS